MMFPLDLWDISLLMAVIAIILLVSSEMLSSYYGKVDVFIDKKKLKNATVAVGIAFFVTVALRIASTIIIS
jgi:hypothetical protein